MTHVSRGDADLHHEDGSHRTTSPSTAGHMLEQHERRIREHLAAHKRVDAVENELTWDAWGEP